VLKLLTPLKMSYEAAKKRAEPYTKIIEELPETRRDRVEFVRKAVAEGREPMCWSIIVRRGMHR